MNSKKFPLIDNLVPKLLSEMYPPLEYQEKVTREEWAFRGGQRDIIRKLETIIKQQEKGGR
jgi:hypothetical protein